MTIANCIKLYKEYVEKGMEKAAENMKNHILTAHKFKDHPFRKELDPTLQKAEVGPAKKEVAKSGKKSKR